MYKPALIYFARRIAVFIAIVFYVNIAMLCVINFKSAQNLPLQLRWCQAQGQVSKGPGSGTGVEGARLRDRCLRGQAQGQVSKGRVLRAPKTDEIIVSINLTVPNHTDKICTMNHRCYYNTINTRGKHTTSNHKSKTSKTKGKMLEDEDEVLLQRK